MRRTQVLAAIAQVQALQVQLEALLGDDVDDQEESCPRCGGKELVEAEDLKVCAGCNANIRDGEVIDE